MHWGPKQVAQMQLIKRPSLAHIHNLPDVRVEHAKAVRKGKEISVRRATFRSYHFRYIYVGNLPPAVTERELDILFSRVGTVTRVTIRSVSGSVSTTPSPSDCSRLYATVIFKCSSSATEALKLNGTIFRDRHLSITQDVLRLPEFDELKKKCEEELNPPPMTIVAATRAAMKAKLLDLKRVTVARTEFIPLDHAAGVGTKGQYQQLLQPEHRKVQFLAS
ncbi:hypothetical protein BXZ70DRAFT_428014 [Cristinia sonorae]|uniref:RRM domain-containing protein n=1 Tax=Cristinia sonorae TaxID=1940300 RepID=A0A8K0XUJ4_9AGAR|nr:hypothetical protein BXZ70DRAFT_428014 [Cristinia sonorae]